MELAVVNERGCTDYAEDVIRVREDLFMYVPNAFTPARGGEGGFADNLNDAWFPSIEGTKVIESYEVCVSIARVIAYGALKTPTTPKRTMERH